MSLTLSIDTATCVAVGIARGSDVLATAVVEDSRAHAEQLMPTVTRVADEAGIDLADVERLVVGMGPGPYTGLRVGIVTAQVLAAAQQIPWRGVCTLDALAAQVGGCDEFAVATDARRSELYWAHYVDGRRIAEPQVSPARDLPGVVVAGPAARLYPETVGRAVDQALTLDAGLLAAQGWELPDVGTEPLYLRRPDAAVSTKRKSVLRRR